MSFVIEKNIPLADASRRKKGESLYPFKQMEVGDSVKIDKNGHKSWAFLYNAITKAQNDHNIKLTSREIDTDSKRVWRTE